MTQLANYREGSGGYNMGVREGMGVKYSFTPTNKGGGGGSLG